MRDEVTEAPNRALFTSESPQGVLVRGQPGLVFKKLSQTMMRDEVEVTFDQFGSLAFDRLGI